MKRTNILISILIAMLLIISGCGPKTVTSREEIKKMADEFYNDLLNEKNVTMSSYANDELISITTIDNDKGYSYPLLADYDFYVFEENGKKYTITDDRTLMEDDITFDYVMNAIKDTIAFTLESYLSTDIEGVSYSAKNNDNKELEIIINGKEGDNEFSIITLGTKENDKVSDIIMTIKQGEDEYKTEYKFTYGDKVILPEYKVPKTYDNLPHVTSPYKTYGEIINKLSTDEYLYYSFYDNQLLVIDEKDGRHYQFSSIVDQDVVDAYENLEFLDDNYYAQVYDLISNIEIEDCIDFTDEIPSENELNNYNGKTIKDLINDGFEVNGWAFFDEGNDIFVLKDSMNYRVSVNIPEGFDTEGEFEYEDFNDFVINKVIFSEPDYSILPMK